LEKFHKTDQIVAREKSPGLLFLCVLALITLTGPVAIHQFFPATPAVAMEFEVESPLAQMTVAVPMFSMALMTLVFGPLADRFGRRPILFWGMTLFMLGGFLSAGASSIWSLIGARLLQGAGGACGLALARAIARDVYGTDRLVQVIAYLTMAYSLGPMIAPPIGGFLVEHFGWRANLLFAGSVGLVMLLLVWCILFETHKKADPQASGSVYKNYLTLILNSRFSAFVLQSGLSSGAFFSLAAASSPLMYDFLNRPASEHGLYFMFFPAGYWLGNWVSSRLAGELRLENMVLLGSSIIFGATSIFAFLSLSPAFTPLSIFLPGFFITLGQGIALPNAQAGAISAAGPNLIGTASGLGVFLQLFMAGCFTQLFGVLADGSPIAAAITVNIAAVSGLFFAFLVWIRKSDNTKWSG
jgi:DHA1 family bicyclomycin/chloramphenicol resistance-like MFS transporter